MARVRSKNQTAEVFLSTGQQVMLVVLVVLGGLYLLFAGPMAFMKIVALLVTVFYALFVGFKLLVAWAGGGFTFPNLYIPDQYASNLPFYGVIVPMRDETREGFAKLVDSLNRLHYRRDRLLILFAVDEDDVRTIDIVMGYHDLPQHMRLHVVKDVGPKTKPKACNSAVGELFNENVERIVIFDFEDRPEPDHLLKAVAALNYAHSLNGLVGCVQGMLQFWNPRSGLASKFYWAEYVVHFRWMLPGLARMGMIPPLGGTSNHFKARALRDVARMYGTLQFKADKGDIIQMPNVWDPYNVTEDADLAARLARAGWEVCMGDFVTYEEAPDTFRKARKQRSRWLKGFWQTALVQSRRPLRSMREMGVLRYLAFNLFVGGTPLSLILNPILWATTLLYIASRIAGWRGVTLFIEQLYPPPVYYTAMFFAVVGNFVMLYQYLLTPLRQQEHASFATTPVGAQAQQFGLNKWLAPLVVFWWVFTTISAYQAVFELLNPRRRFYWSKTPHSHAVGRELAVLGTGTAPALAAGPADASAARLRDQLQQPGGRDRDHA